MGESIIRTVKDREHPYTMVPRRIIEDTRLSWEARAVLIYLISKPNGWETRVDDLMARGDAGRDKVHRILRELVDAGYMTRNRRQHDESGRWITVTSVFEDPESNPNRPKPAESTVNGFAVHGETVDGKTVNGKPVRIVSTEGKETEGNKDGSSPADESVSGGRPDKPKTERQLRDEKRSALEVHFHEQTGLEMPRRATDKDRRAGAEMWWNPLSRILDLVGWDLDRATAEVDATLNHMYAEELTVASPKSIVAVTEARIAKERNGGNGHGQREGHSESNGKWAGQFDAAAWLSQEQPADPQACYAG